MSARILLITDAGPGLNIEQMQRIVEQLGYQLLIAPCAAATQATADHKGLVLVDATYVVDSASMVTSILRKSSSMRVVVITASPTWQRARSAFEAGAVDYLSKNMPPQEFTVALQQALSACPPTNRGKL